MDIEEVRRLKQIAEKEIAEAIKHFSNQTNCPVTAIELTFSVSYVTRLVNVKLTIEV